MQVRWIAGIAPIPTDVEASLRFYRDAIGLPLTEGDYIASDDVAGVKHFGLWRIEDVAESCFGLRTWPTDLPIPQASLEFEVSDAVEVEAAARHLETAGYTLVHGARAEPWGQTLTRLLSPEGLLIGVSYTPWQRAMQAGETIGFLESMRAVREYRNEPVPDAALADILQVARTSGSAMNRQPWQFVVVRDPVIRQQLANLAGYVDHIVNAPIAILLVMDGEHAFDEGRLAERIMLAAAAHGLGSCIGWFADTAIGDALTLINAPSGSYVRTAIGIGYPVVTGGGHPAPGKPDRKPLESLVHYDQFP